MTGDTTITITLLIALGGVLMSAVSLIINIKKGIRSEAKDDSMAMTTVAVKLENLQDYLKEIKSDFSTNMTDLKKDIADIRSEMGSCRDRITRLEERVKGGLK